MATLPTGWIAIESPPSGLHDDRPLLDAIGGEDGHLGLVDDRRGDQRAVRPGVGDGERAAGHVVGCELLAAGPLGEVADLPGDQPEPLALGVLHDRHDQAL